MYCWPILTRATDVVQVKFDDQHPVHQIQCKQYVTTCQAMQALAWFMSSSVAHVVVYS